MKILILTGNLGYSVIDHLINPLAQSNNIKDILIICRRPGPNIIKVKYICPPNIIAHFSLIAIIYEYLSLFILALFSSTTFIIGYLLIPHGLIAFALAKITGKRIGISLIAGPFELYKLSHGPLGIDYNKPLSFIGKFMIDVMKKSDFIITTGSVTKRFLIKHGIDDFKIYSMINPPNITHFYPRTIAKKYDVISVASLIPLKHHEVLLKASSLVQKRFPNIKICIVGNGPEINQLMRLSEELKIKSNVDFVGFQKDVNQFYNSSRIFVHTSEREGFPNVVLEAMMCGLPCVVSDCGDITDLAKDGINSLVIQKFNDYEGYANAIIRLLEDKELYQKLSQNALNTMEALSSADVTHKWELILDKVNAGD